MIVYQLIEEKIGKIESLQAKLFEAYCNKVLLHELIASDGRVYKCIEKEFISDPDYPKKKLVESQIITLTKKLKPTNNSIEDIDNISKVP